MSRTRRIAAQTILYVLVAAICGLIVWGVMMPLIYNYWHSSESYILDAGVIMQRKFITVFMIYVPLGLLLGLAMAIIEPVQQTGFRAAIQGNGKLLISASFLGALGGALGGGLGEFVMHSLEQVLTAPDVYLPKGLIVAIPRTAGAICLGFGIGTALGMFNKIKSGSKDRLIAGIVGGGLGGMLSALVFVLIYENIAAMVMFSSITLAVTILGSIGSVTSMMTDGILAGMRGNIYKYSDAMIPVELFTDAPNIIGGYDPSNSSKATFRIFHEAGILLEHAIIEKDRETGDWHLQRAQPNVMNLEVNGYPIGGDRVILRDSSVIKFGSTRLKFFGSSSKKEDGGGDV